MFFPGFIRWLAELPPAYALSILWWIEFTVYGSSISGGILLCDFIHKNLDRMYENLIFGLSILIFLVLFYIIHFTFTKISELMEALINIHRHGGLNRLLMASAGNPDPPEDQQDEFIQYDDDPPENPLDPPTRIRASAGVFKTRYFIVLPTAFLLYFIGFASTIYRIFVRQILTLEAGLLVVLACVVVIICTICFWQLQPYLPGYVSVRKLMGRGNRRGE